MATVTDEAYKTPHLSTRVFNDTETMYKITAGYSTGELFVEAREYSAPNDVPASHVAFRLCLKLPRLFLDDDAQCLIKLHRDIFEIDDSFRKFTLIGREEIKEVLEMGVEEGESLMTH